MEQAAVGGVISESDHQVGVLKGYLNRRVAYFLLKVPLPFKGM